MMMLHTQHLTTTPMMDTNEAHQDAGFRSVLRRWKAGFKSNMASRARLSPKTSSGPQQQKAQPSSLYSSNSSLQSPSQPPLMSPGPGLPLPDSAPTPDRLMFKSTTQTIIHSPLDKRNRGSVSSSYSTCILRRSPLGPRRDTIAQDCSFPPLTPKTWSDAASVEPASSSSSSSGSRMSGRASTTSTRNSKGRFSIKVGSTRCR